MEKGNHITTATTCLVAAGAIIYSQSPEIISQNLPTVTDKVIFCASFLVGTTLPDIDQKIKYIKHRTFTHSFLFLIMLLLPGIFYRPLLGLFFASFHHILIDSFSAQGVAFFWPFQGYIRYDNGKSIKSGYHIKLYKAKSTAESILAVIICLFNLAIAVSFLSQSLSGFNFSLPNFDFNRFKFW